MVRWRLGIVLYFYSPLHAKVLWFTAWKKHCPAHLVSNNIIQFEECGMWTPNHVKDPPLLKAKALRWGPIMVFISNGGK